MDASSSLSHRAAPAARRQIPVAIPVAGGKTGGIFRDRTLPTISKSQPPNALKWVRSKSNIESPPASSSLTSAARTPFKPATPLSANRNRAQTPKPTTAGTTVKALAIKRNAERITLEQQISSKRKNYLLEKRRLTDAQKQLLDTNTAIRQLQQKHRRLCAESDRPVTATPLEPLILMVEVDASKSATLNDETELCALDAIESTTTDGTATDITVAELRQELRKLIEDERSLCQQCLQVGQQIVAENLCDAAATTVTKCETSIMQMKQLVAERQSEQIERIKRILQQCNNNTSNSIAGSISANSSAEFSSRTIVELNKQIASLQERLELFENRSSAVNRSGCADCKEKDDAREQLLAAHDKMLSELEQRKTAVQRAEEEAAIKALKQELQQSQADVKKYADQVERLLVKHEETDGEYKKRIETLSAELDDERKHREQLAHLVHESHGYIAQLEQAGRDLQQSDDQSGLVDELKALRIAVQSLRDENHALDAELENTRAEHTNAMARKAEELYAVRERVADLEYRIEMAGQTMEGAEGEEEEEARTSGDDPSSNSGSSDDSESVSMAAAAGDVTLIQQSDLQALHDELHSVKHTAGELERSLSVHQQLLRIRSELIGTMQAQEDTVRQQLSAAQEMALARQEELQLAQATVRAREATVERQARQIAELEQQRVDNDRLQVQVEEQTSRLMDENERLREQFGQILNCRHLEDN